MKSINVLSKFAEFEEHWSPKIIAELNGQIVKAVKFEGDFLWHYHDHEDEMFMVVEGEFEMLFRDRTEKVRKGEFIVVPRGVEHCPRADTECWVILFEPASTLNTGNVANERTKEVLERL